MKEYLSVFLILLLLVGCIILASCDFGKGPSDETSGDQTEETTADDTGQESGGDESSPPEKQLNGIGLTGITVYCPEGANAWEKRAANDLAEKLGQVIGSPVKVSSEHQQNEIFIGKGCLDAEYKSNDYSQIGYNGYQIFVRNGKIVLTAKTDIGIASAINEYLSSGIGTEDGEFVTEKNYAKIKTEKLPDTVKPDEKKHLDVQLDPGLGYDVYLVPEVLPSGYRYGPSIMVHEDGSMDAWFASSGCGGNQWDWITWKHSSDGVNWSDEKVVLQPTPDGLDHYSCCDPGVIYFNGYYYLGYTSTVNNNQKDNCIFVARSENPDGPYEKWNGSGWGGNNPQPIIYFGEQTELWGAGEPSFVELNGTLYIYYTWAGTNGHVTYSATADATDDNWPATIVLQDAAVVGTNNDSLDVKYVEKYGKFLAVSTDSRMTANSYLVFFESNDGIHFTKTDIAKEYASWYCHNAGIAGSENGHIVEGRKCLVGYAYGEGWGIWNTRFQEFTIGLVDECDFSELQGGNVHTDATRDKRASAELPLAGITPLTDDVYTVSKGKSSFTVKLYAYNSYHDNWFLLASFDDGKDIKYSGYDPNVVQCTDGTNKIQVIGEGQTVITMEWRGFYTSIAVHVTNLKQTPEITGISPLVQDEFNIDLDAQLAFVPQLKAKIDYSDFTWVEAFGSMVTYSDYDKNVISINHLGQVQGLNQGSTDVTISAGGKSCRVKVNVKGQDKPYDYTHLEFESGDKALKLIREKNNTTAVIEDGVLKLTANPASDPLVKFDYTSIGYDTEDIKSITIEYMIPDNLSAKTFKGQLFFNCGNNAQDSEERAQKYDMTADGQWHTVKVDLAGRQWWSGKLLTVRLDYFDSCKDNDYIFIKSITLDE